jgi:electron transfer flavoprotein beta subunit
MNIVVCVKQVPDTNEVKIDPVTNNLIREGVPGIMNPFDKNAMEEALQIRGKLGGKVTAVSMGPLQAVQTLQYALDMGADNAFLLSDKLAAGSDTLATGYALSVLVKTCSPDLILCGAEAVDGCTGQVGPAIAENLGFPQLSYVNQIVNIDKKEIEVSREVKEIYEILRCSLPALVCVLKGINEPRKPVASPGKPEILSVSDLMLDKNRIGIAGSPTRVAKIDMLAKASNSFVVIDNNLPADEKIISMINGGIVPKKIRLTRGSPEKLAECIFEDEIFEGHLRN